MLNKIKHDTPADVNDYSDSSKIFQLPFPYCGDVPAQRFTINSAWSYSYMGREKFSDLYEEIKLLQPNTYRKIFVHGTIGYGKSHILAAMVCYLLKSGKKVVYLPDCRGLYKNFKIYLRRALYISFGKSIGQQIA